MIESGLLVAVGLLVIFARLSWRAKIWMLSHPLLMDLIVFAGLTALHWGTFSGVMAATIGALTCSLMLSLGQRLFGCYRNDSYVRGFFDKSGALK